jgi:hypothetical protein
MKRNVLLSFFQGCGSGLINPDPDPKILLNPGIRIHIHNVIESGSNQDPDPQQYFRRKIFSKIKKSTKSQIY